MLSLNKVFLVFLLGAFLGGGLVGALHKVSIEDYTRVNTHLHSEINEIVDEYEKEVDFWFKATLECEQSSPNTYYLPHIPEPTRLEM